MVVYTAGISRKVSAHYPGRSHQPRVGYGEKSAAVSVSRTKYSKYFDAVLMMRAGPSESAYRRRFQTAFMLLSLKGMVVSDKGKGIIKDVRYVLRRRTQVNHL